MRQVYLLRIYCRSLESPDYTFYVCEICILVNIELIYILLVISSHSNNFRTLLCFYLGPFNRRRPPRMSDHFFHVDIYRLVLFSSYLIHDSSSSL